MKFLHFADLHIGMENYGRIDPATGLHSRLIDFSNTFRFLTDHATGEKVDLVVFAGDAFKTREPSPTHENIFASGIKRLSDAGIPVVLVVGNHDLPNTAGKSDTLTIYDALDITNVHVSSKPQLLRIKDAQGNPVQVATLPWVTKSHILAREEYSGKSIEEINEIMTGKLVGIIDTHAEAADPTIPTLFVSHATVAGASFGSEQSVMLGSDIVIPLGALKNPKFHYVALGHLHKHQVLSEDPPVIYAGSPDRIDFGEEKEDKGFIVGTITVGQKTTYEFVKTPTREFMTIEVTLTKQDQSPTEKIVAAIKRHNLTGKVVRLKIDVPQEVNSLISDKVVQEALSSAHYFSGTQKFIRVAARKQSRAGEVTTDLSPLDALDRYAKAKSMDVTHAQELKKEAEKLIREVQGEI